MKSKSIQELPLNGRMLLDLALTVPGAHISHGAQAGDMNPLYWRPGQASAISIGGNRPNANYFLVDGVSNTDPTFNTQSISLSPDAVREFQVQTGSYAAEMGGAGGGVGDPEPLPRDQRPHLGYQVAHESDVVGVAVGMSAHGHGQAGRLLCRWGGVGSDRPIHGDSH